jgi:hypothetical protein
VTDYPNPTDKKKKIKHTQGTLQKFLVKVVNSDFTTIEGCLLKLKLITDSNKNDSKFQVLCMSESDWTNSRLKLAQTGSYKGYGVAMTVPKLKSHHAIVGKYYVDRQKLGNGILDIRYARNKHLTNIKPQYLGEGLKTVIHKMIDEKTVDKNAYHQLNSQEKHLVRNLNNMFDINE